jgi:hypothetical protein
MKTHLLLLILALTVSVFADDENDTIALARPKV